MITSASTAMPEDATGAPDTGPEMRKAERVPYRALVLAAPYDGQQLPERCEFHEVRARDLSPTGISFETDAAPPSRRMVLLFGQAGRAPIYVVARVVHFTEFMASTGPLYLVGCELQERLQAETDPG